MPLVITNLCPGADAKDEREVVIARAGSVAESQPQDFDLESISKVFFSLWDRHLACTNSSAKSERRFLQIRTSGIEARCLLHRVLR